MGTMLQFPTPRRILEPTAREAEARLRAAQVEYFRALIAHLRAQKRANDRYADRLSRKDMRLYILATGLSHFDSKVARDAFCTWYCDEDEPGS